MAVAPKRFLIGTSGFAYDDWVGPFYPPAIGTQKHEWLSYYADYFPTLEINSSYYSMPTEPMVKAWVEKSRGREFEFSLKVPRSVTHDHMVDGHVEEAERDLDAFLAVTAPLADERKRGPLLFQLSPYFRHKEPTLDALRAVLQRARGAGATVAVELRHESWLDRTTYDLQFDAKRVLRENDAALVVTDGPGFPPLNVPTATHGYVRFHGRNRDMWFGRGRSRGRDEEPAGLLGFHRNRPGRDDEHDDARDDVPYVGVRMNRYDYLYNETELEPWAKRLKEAARQQSLMRVYFNNHPAGKAPKNALQFMDMVGVPHKAKDIRVQTQGRLDLF